MKRTLEVLNDLEREGIFSRYAIGGAMGAIFYTEPFLTFDLDVCFTLPNTAGFAPAVAQKKTSAC